MPEWLDFEGSNYQLLEGDAKLADDVELRFTPGHTPGHQSVVVRGPEDLDLIVAQAAQTARLFDAFDATSAPDSDEGRSLALLHSLKPNRAWFSHGDEYWTPAAIKPVDDWKARRGATR